MNEENYYEILNLNENASMDSIRANYKKLILIYHPDKKILNISDEEKITKFLKIREAYNVLSNEQTRKEYNNKLNLNNNKLLNLSSVIQQITSDIKKIFSYSEYNTLLTLLDNKIKNNLIAEKNLEDLFIKLTNTNTLEILSSTNIFKILDIDITVDFTIEEVYLNKHKIISYQRITKDTFKEKIYPIDLTQIYETEGEIFISGTNTYQGDLNVVINVCTNLCNNIDYKILNVDLYTIFKKNSDNTIKFKHLDGVEYVFDLENVSYTENDFGLLYSIDNFGLPYYDTDVDFIDETNINNISRGKLFFLIE
jgi:curved DNA-binding protein CbpA